MFGDYRFPLGEAICALRPAGRRGRRPLQMERTLAPRVYEGVAKIFDF